MFLNLPPEGDKNKKIEDMLTRLHMVLATPTEECVAEFKVHGVSAKLLNALTAMTWDNDKELLIHESILESARNTAASQITVESLLSYFRSEPVPGAPNQSNALILTFELINMFQDILEQCEQDLLDVQGENN